MWKPNPIKLKLHVEEGKNLISRDKNGFSDPYVKMYITGPGKIPSSATKGVKTKVEKKTLNPKWENQVLELEIEEELAKSSADVLLNVEIRDKDRMGTDSMGILPPIPLKSMLEEAKIPWFSNLNVVENDFSAPLWVKVEKDPKKMNDDVSGELKILFEYSVGDSRLCQNLLGQLSETKGGDGVEQQRAVLILLNVGKFRADLKYGKNYPLFLAGRAGNIQIMGILLRFGAVLKHHDSEAGDVLGHARSVINEGMKMRMLEVLFSSPQAVEVGGEDLLKELKRYDGATDPKVVAFYISKGVKPSAECITAAAKKPEILKIMTGGQDGNGGGIEVQKGKFVAAMTQMKGEKRREIVKETLKNAGGKKGKGEKKGNGGGIDVNMMLDIQYRSLQPIWGACLSLDFELAKILLEYGANPQVREGHSLLTPLYTAMEEVQKKVSEKKTNKFLKLAELLVSYGADPCGFVSRVGARSYGRHPPRTLWGEKENYNDSKVPLWIIPEFTRSCGGEAGAKLLKIFVGDENTKTQDLLYETQLLDKDKKREDEEGLVGFNLLYALLKPGYQFRNVDLSLVIEACLETHFGLKTPLDFNRYIIHFAAHVPPPLFARIIETYVKYAPEFLNKKDAKGKTPLHFAAKLLSNLELKTPLPPGDYSEACLSVKTASDAMSFLLSQEGVDPLVVSCDGRNVFHFVRDSGVAKVLFEKIGGEDLKRMMGEKGKRQGKRRVMEGDCPLHVVVGKRDKKLVKVFVEGGREKGVELKEEWGVKNCMGINAVELGQIINKGLFEEEGVEEEIGKEVFLGEEEVEKLRWELFFKVISSQSTKVRFSYDFLADFSYDPLRKDEETGNTLMHAALLSRIERGNPVYDRRLLMKGHSKAGEVQNKKGETPAFYAVRIPYFDTNDLKSLMGTSGISTDFEGNTLLHVACKSSNSGIAQFLILKELVDISLKNNQGRTAFDLVDRNSYDAGDLREFLNGEVFRKLILPKFPGLHVPRYI